MTPSTGLGRSSKDKFYTRQPVAEACTQLAADALGIAPGETVVEPSAGGGAFVSCIKKLTTQHLFMDLEPAHPEVSCADFLEFDPTSLQAGSSARIHVLGNPPFGRQSSLAARFIRKACSFSDSVSFVLPRSFKKPSMHRCFPLGFHLVAETDIPDSAFTIDGHEHDVPCVFQVWIKRATDRTPPAAPEPSGFLYVKKTDPHDLAVRRVGARAGRITTDTESESTQTHYFIRLLVPVSDEMIGELVSLDFPSKSLTVGPNSISKPELTARFNAVISKFSSH